MHKELTIIVGPTSTGKTSLALELSKKCHGVIISADSRQVYKDMDIGTGKSPVTKDYTIIKNRHHWTIDDVEVWGYDLTAPDKYFSAYDYAKFAIKKINTLRNSGKKVFVVGGTGFYVDIVTGRKNISCTRPDFELREKLESYPTEALVNMLNKYNPHAVQKVDINNKRRLIRAIEREQNYKTLTRNELEKIDYEKVQYIGLTAPREYLYAKVDHWLEHIWKNGLLEETTYLLKKYPKSYKLQGLIYKTAISFLNRVSSEDDAIQRAKFDLHAYVRRQQTWFKQNNLIDWVDITNLNYKLDIENKIKC